MDSKEIFKIASVVILGLTTGILLNSSGNYNLPDLKEGEASSKLEIELEDPSGDAVSSRTLLWTWKDGENRGEPEKIYVEGTKRINISENRNYKIAAFGEYILGLDQDQPPIYSEVKRGKIDSSREEVSLEVYRGYSIGNPMYSLTRDGSEISSAEIGPEENITVNLRLLQDSQAQTYYNPQILTTYVEEQNPENKSVVEDITVEGGSQISPKECMRSDVLFKAFRIREKDSEPINDKSNFTVQNITIATSEQFEEAEIIIGTIGRAPYLEDGELKRGTCKGEEDAGIYETITGDPLDLRNS